MTKPTLRELLEQTLPPYQPGTHPRYYSMDEARALWIDGARVGLDRAAELAEEAGKYVKGGYNNAAHEIAAAIRAEKEWV